MTHVSERRWPPILVGLTAQKALGTDEMASLQDIQKHVVDDAKELLACIAVFTPLVTDFSPESDAIGETEYDVAHFMRGHFGRQIVLLVLRMHASKPPRPERTGETASIPTLIDAAEAEGAVPPEASGFRFRRSRIWEDAEGDGLSLDAMKSFRDAELGHTLHRNSTESDGTLRADPILELAHQTFELVLSIEQRLGGQTLDPWYNSWMTKGQWFWAKIAERGTS